MKAKVQIDLSRLLDVTRSLAASHGVTRMEIMGDFGLYIHEKIAPWIYPESPRNAVCFASTGGDGVHFSVLTATPPKRSKQRSPKGAGIDGPVVMTVPMMGNVILGESLREFLCLGFFQGWFSLEQLVYGKEGTIRFYRRKRTRREALLREFCSALALEHQPLRAKRLRELDLRHRSTLVTNESVLG